MAGAATAEKLAQLRALPEGSRERLDLAVALVGSERGFDALYAALSDLEAHGEGVAAADESAKKALGSRFQYLADNGPRRDPSCLLRAQILRVLRGSLDADDIPLLEAAAVHYEQVGGAETGAGLREAALLGLDDLDGELAATHAVRLLGETRAAIPPDEASATAVRLLASREMLLPLYLYVLLPGGSPALASECLRHLTSLPAALLPPLIASVAESRNVVVAVGLMDLLVSHEEWREHQDTVLEFLASTADLEAHYYVLTSIVAGHRPELMDEVVAMARIETREERLRNYVAALSLRDYDDAIAEIVADLERRLEGA